MFSICLSELCIILASLGTRSIMETKFSSYKLYIRYSVLNFIHLEHEQIVVTSSKNDLIGFAI